MDVPDIHEHLLYPLQSYLGETGGYDKSLPVNKQKSDEPAKQHSFVVMHFSATFTQLAVSLGHIFKCEIGDIDMRDVVLNRRILVVNLPTLENSGETTASLGRLVVSSLRNMMAQTLGADLEGDFAEIVENKPHLAPTPFPVVFDEVGYYVVPGMDKMLAMGRGLGFMFYLGFQEVAGLRARIGDSMYSLLGNANLQILMRLQEGSETRKYVEQTAGDTNVTQASSFQANEFGVFRENMNADVRQVSRVNWTDLRSLIEGEAIVLLGKDRVYAKMFYAEIDANGPMRMNRAVMLMPPAADDIRQQGERRKKTLKHLLSGKTALLQAVTPSPTLDALITGFAHRLVEHPEQDFGVTAHAAILGLIDVQPSPGEAPKPVTAAADGSVAETEYSIMVKSTGAPASAAPIPDTARKAAAPKIASGDQRCRRRFWRLSRRGRRQDEPDRRHAGGCARRDRGGPDHAHHGTGSPARDAGRHHGAAERPWPGPVPIGPGGRVMPFSPSKPAVIRVGVGSAHLGHSPPWCVGHPLPRPGRRPRPTQAGLQSGRLPGQGIALSLGGEGSRRDPGGPAAGLSRLSAGSLGRCGPDRAA